MAATFSGLIVARAAAGPEAVQQLPRDVEQRREVGAGELACDHLLEQITAAQPRYAKYQRKTDRELPVIHLVPRPG